MSTFALVVWLLAGIVTAAALVSFVRDRRELRKPTELCEPDLDDDERDGSESTTAG